VKEQSGTIYLQHADEERERTYDKNLLGTWDEQTNVVVINQQEGQLGCMTILIYQQPLSNT